MNIIERFKYLKYYCKVLNDNRQDLYEKFNIRIDNVYRMYTVYHIDEVEYKTYGGDKPIIHEKKTIEEYLTVNSNSGAMMNGEDYFKLVVNKNISRLDQYLISIGLSEMYGLSSKQRLDKYNTKVVIEYKYLSTTFLANISLLGGITVIGSSIIGGLLLLFL